MDDPQTIYAAIRNGCAVLDRPSRGLIELTGKDRFTWLHNLVTNHVKTLQCGEGTYAFAVNLQGRIVFDVNVFARPTSLWLEMDRSIIEPAIKHLNKYAVIEDVSLKDISTARVQIGLCGKNTAPVLNSLGATQAPLMPLLNIADFTFENSTIALARTDFCGSLGFDLWIEQESIAHFTDHLDAPQNDHRVTRANKDAIRIHQIEAGIPTTGHEITDDVLPAETDQLHRAVSFNKGCYLGQEVVERMRSRGIVARKLSGLLVDGDFIPPKDTALFAADGKTTVGKVTSACRSIALNRVIALAYVKSAFATDATILNLVWSDGSTAAKLTPLPFVDTNDKMTPA